MKVVLKSKEELIKQYEGTISIQDIKERDDYFGLSYDKIYEVDKIQEESDTIFVFAIDNDYSSSEAYHLHSFMTEKEYLAKKFDNKVDKEIQ